jgi:DnaD and phage-associated domain
MNYITEINRFYDLMLSKPLSTGQIALWYALMQINNKCAWIKWFSVPNQTLELLTGLSRQGIDKNRNVLKQLGLIDFKSKGNKATMYMLNSLQESLQSGLQDSIQNSVPDGGTLTKQNNTTLNYTKQTQECDCDVNELRECVDFCAKVYNTVPSKAFTDEITARLQSGVDTALIKEALKLSAEKSPNVSYLRAIMRNWYAEGITTYQRYCEKTKSDTIAVSEKKTLSGRFSSKLEDDENGNT